MTKTLRKVFTFPKVAYSSNRRINTPQVEMELRYKGEDPSKPEFAISGGIWNATKTDYIMCGQCLDEMMKIHSLHCDPLFRKLYRLWEKWHLNDMHAGTIKQEQAIKDARKSGKLTSYDYNKTCDYLASINLLEDNGYKYGSSWLYHEIDKADMDEIMALFNSSDNND